MSVRGGRLWIRATGLLLAAAGAAGGLSGCEYGVNGADPMPTRSGTSQSALPSPLPPAPDLADTGNRNVNDLETLLGARPAGVVLGGTGGLGAGGFRVSAERVAKGRYAVTAACVGAPTAVFSMSQNGLRGGARLELTLDCGKATRAQIDVRPGPVQVEEFRSTTVPGAVAGFWMVPAAAGS
jgi:hypothetical protein